MANVKKVPVERLRPTKVLIADALRGVKTAKFTGKMSVADFVRLVQLRKEYEPPKGQVKEVKVRWVEPTNEE